MKKISLLFAMLMMVVSGAWADGVTPVAVWNGDFGTTSKMGFSLEMNGNTNNTTSLAIASDATKGIKVALNEARYGTAQQKISVLVKYSNFTAPSASKSILGVTQNEGCNDIGLYATSTGVGGYYNSNGNYGLQTLTVPKSGWMLMTYNLTANSSDGISGYVGTVGDNDAITWSTRCGASSLRFTKATYYYTGIMIGGPSNTSSFGPLSGLTIDKIAIFDQVITTTQASAYVSNTDTRYAEITADKKISDLITATGTNDVNLYASNDAILTLDESVTGANITLDVAEGKTLTIATSGSYNFDATTAIKVIGKGSVKIASTSVFADAITGSGNLIYTGSTSPSSTVVATSWTGSVQLEGTYSSGFAVTYFGNSSSTVIMNCNFSTYFSNTSFTFGTFSVADGKTVNITDGWSGNIFTINKLTGSGTLKFTKPSGAPTLWLKIVDALEFTGSLSNEGDATNSAITIAGSYSSKPAGGKIYLNGEYTIAAGKTLTAPSGVELGSDANVTVGSSACTAAFTGSGTVTFKDFAKCPTNVTFKDNWTGTVVIPAINAPGQVDLHNMGNTSSTIKLMGITGNSYIAESDVTINPTVIIAGDVVFNNGSSSKTYTFKKIVGTSDNKNLSLVGWNTCTGVTYKINELSSFGGTLSSTGTNITTTVNKLVLSETPTVGTKVLSTSGNPTVSSVYVGETAMSSDLFTMKDDGLYYNKVARTTVANGYGTICLPYDATSTGVILMECAGKSADGNGIVFNYVDGTGVNANLEAGKPYLYRATAATQTFTTTGTEYKDATADDYNFVGTYTAQTLTNSEYFLYSKTLNNGGDDKFHPAGDYVNISAYKCYFTALPTEEARANTNSCVFGIFGDEATGIQSINTSVDLNKDGKFVENGRVVIIKNGKKFNTAGQAVK